MDLVLPLHPRTAKMLKSNLTTELYERITQTKQIKIIPPVSFLDMIWLEQQAAMIVTDSGGVQKEASFIKEPCLILRPETEWKEIVEVGAAMITDTDKKCIIAAYKRFLLDSITDFPEILGNGKATEFIC